MNPPNVDAIMQDIRARVARETVPPPAPAEGPPPFGWLAAQEEVVVRDGWNLWDVELSSPRGGLAGTAISALKKAVRRLLAPVLDKQMTFNRTIADMVCDVRERTRMMIVNQAQTREAIERARSAEAAVLAETQTMRERLDRLEARDHLPPGPLAGSADGSEDSVRERRRGWVGQFMGRRAVLDLSPGRGELLALLTEAGVRARGVAPEEAFAELTRASGGSVDGIFCAELLANLPLVRLMTFLAACRRALAPGAPFVVETSAVVPPAVLRTLLEVAGFRELEVIASGPDGSRHYAVVARGAAA